MSFWDTEEIYLSGDDYFERLLADIDAAREYITVEIYMFNDDVLGDKLARGLISAYERGVRVQVIVDGVGSLGFHNRLHGLFQQSGITVKLYNPIPFLHPFFGDMTFWRRLRLFFTRVWRLNRRNHRKIVTIDAQIMYAGSFNFTVEHTCLHRGKAWKDMGVRVSGRNVRFAVLHFKRNWKLRDYYRYKKKLGGVSKGNWRHSPLRLYHSLMVKRYFYKNFLSRIQRAQKRIWFITPYFIPRRRVIKALGAAARRGVDVRLLVSSRSDVELFRTLQYFYYPYLVKSGVKVWQYTDTILHAKNYIVDDWMTIGSTNLNHRSLIHDLEVDLVVQEPRNLQLLEEHFLSSLTGQTQVTQEELGHMSLKDKLLMRLYFIFRYWF